MLQINTIVWGLGEHMIVTRSDNWGGRSLIKSRGWKRILVYNYRIRRNSMRSSFSSRFNSRVAPYPVKVHLHPQGACFASLASKRRRNRTHLGQDCSLKRCRTRKCCWAITRCRDFAAGICSKFGILHYIQINVREFTLIASFWYYLSST